MAKNSPKKIATNNAWTNAHYDRINLAIPKGHKEIIREAAAQNEQSVNAWISEAINEKLNEGYALSMDLSQADGFSLSQIEHAAEQAGLSVNGWIMEAIKQAL